MNCLHKYRCLFIWSILLLAFGPELQGQASIVRSNIVGPKGISVNSFTGNMLYQRRDLYLPGRGLSLDISFSYNSNRRDKDRGVGYGWSFIYSMCYRVDTNGIVIEKANGREDLYTSNGSGYDSPTGVYDVLSQYQPGRYRLRMKDGMSYYFDNSSHKKLSRIVDRNGNTISLSYVGLNPSSITDPSGRTLSLSWVNNKLTQVVDNNGASRSVQYQYDSNGNLKKVINPLGDETVFSYDNDHNLTKITDEDGYNFGIAYNDSMAVSQLLSGESYQKITYNEVTHSTYLVERVNGENQTTTFRYDEDGRLIRQSGSCCGYDMSFTYNSDDQIATMTDANGNLSSFTYDSYGNVLTRTDGGGNTTAFAYEYTYHQMVSQTNPRGFSTTYFYDANGNLTQTNMPLGISKSYTYDGFGNQTSMTDGNGNTTNYSYDSNGYLIQVQYPLSVTESFTYDNRGNKLTHTNPRGNSVTYTYDLMNRVTSLTDPTGGTSLMTYDGRGNKTSLTDPLGRVLSLSFNSVGKIASMTDPLGNTTQFFYDGNGNLIRKIDPVGRISRYAYNLQNLLTSSTNPAGETTTFNYDGAGNVTLMSTPDQNVMLMQHDSRNKLSAVTDQKGLFQTMSYDPNGNMLTETNSNGKTRIYQYDALDRLISTTDGGGQTTQFLYDANSNLIQRTDPNGNITLYTFDALNRNTVVTDAIAGTTTYAYDGNSNLISLTDSEGNQTTYAFNSLEYLVSETFPDNSTVTYVRDAIGNITSRTDRNGAVTSYSYDNLGRLTGRDYPGNNDDAFTYDAVGRIVSATNANATVSFVYDQANRILVETSNGVSTQFSYDIPNRTRTIQYPSGRQVVESMDVRENLSQLSDGTGILAQYNYDPGDRLLSQTHGNGTATTYTYDARERVQQIKHDPVGFVDLQYGYDGYSNRLYTRKNHRPTHSEQYSFDALHRVSNFKVGNMVGVNIPAPASQTQLTYDGNANRVSKNTNGVLTNYVSNSISAYTSIVENAVPQTPTYNGNGNLTQFDGNTYQYDTDHRIVGLSGSTSATYTFDALGRRISKTVAGNTTRFYYDGPRVIEERNGSNQVEATYVWGRWIDDLISMDRNGNRYYFHKDDIGSVHAVTDTSGAVVERYAYDLYGSPTVYSPTYTVLGASAIGNPYLFAGRRWDAELGMYFNRARNYHPGLGRFAQPDPLGYVDTMNPYEYVRSRPTNLVDPLGFQGCQKDNRLLDWFQTGLDIAGLIPGLGEPFDLLNAGIYAARGDYLNAGLSAGSAIPVAGWFSAGGKFINKGMKFGGKSVVVGETMTRVDKAARKFNAGTLEMPDWINRMPRGDAKTAAMMDYNQKWLQDHMDKGTDIIDIGRDAKRADPSAFYDMEQEMLKNYKNMNPDWRDHRRLNPNIPSRVPLTPFRDRSNLWNPDCDCNN